MAKKVSIITMANELTTKTLNAENPFTHVIESHEYETYQWNDKRTQSYIVEDGNALSAMCLSGRPFFNKSKNAFDGDRILRIEIESSAETPTSAQPIKYWHICDCETIFPIYKPTDFNMHVIACPTCGMWSAQIQEVKN